MNTGEQQVPAPGGGILEVIAAGPIDGIPLVFSTATPGGAAPFPPLIEVARQHGMRVIHYSRPGFGRSTARPGRSIADTAGDIASILDALDADRFVTIGFSGGGPHALAAGVLLSGRCGAVASVSGVAPYTEMKGEWFAGMNQDNCDEFSLALAGTDALTEYLEAEARKLAAMEAQPLDAETLARPDAADIAAFREFMARTIRSGVAHGIAGWRDDDLALMRPWGFEPARIACPVMIWHGEADNNVPVAHGRWLTSRIKGAVAHFEPELAHGAVLRTHFRTIVAELAKAQVG